jgi:hypothetical protein
LVPHATREHLLGEVGLAAGALLPETATTKPT